MDQSLGSKPASGPAGSPSLFLQSIQFFMTFCIELLGIEKKVITYALETIITVLHQFAMVFTLHLLDAFVEMLRSMKKIEHDLGRAFQRYS